MMLQLDLTINLNTDLPGQITSDGLRLCLHRLEELDSLINKCENTQVLWKKIMGNSGFIFDMFTWPENVMLLSMMNPGHDLAFSALSHEKRSEIQGAIMEMDIDLGHPDIFLCSEYEYREYRTALHETIEKFI
jgi:hypothetical protein